MVFNWWRKPEYPKKITDLSQVTDKLYNVVLSLFNNVVHFAMNGVRTHNWHAGFSLVYIMFKDERSDAHRT
jgi:ABC-type polysaccharide/polyol phosphate export permease